MTMRYLKPIEALSDEQYELIVNEVQKHVKKGKGIVTASSMDTGDENDEDFSHLFAFR